MLGHIRSILGRIELDVHSLLNVHQVDVGFWESE